MKSNDAPASGRHHGLTLAALILILGSVLPRDSAAAVVRVTCPAAAVVTGASFNSGITIDAGSSALGAYTLKLTFDPAVVVIDSVAGGGAVEFSGTPNTDSVTFTKGLTTIAAFNATSLTSPTGNVSVATVTFDAIGPLAAAQIGVQVAGVFDTDGSSIVVTGEGCGFSVITPTPSPTRTSTHTRTPTITRTPTRTPTPVATPSQTPTPGNAQVQLRLGVGLRGSASAMGRACMHGSLVASGRSIATVSTRLGFNSNVFGIEGCVINSQLSGTPFNKQFSTEVTGPGEVEVNIGGSPAGMQDGEDLFLCTLFVSSNASPGNFPIAIDVTMNDPQGVPVPVAGGVGTVRVIQCNGDCDGSGGVSIGEVVKALNVFGDARLCNAAEPVRSCPVADTDHSGRVSIGEVVQSLNRFGNGCP